MLLNFNCNSYILMWVKMFASKGQIQAKIVWNALYLNLYKVRTQCLYVLLNLATG